MEFPKISNVKKYRKKKLIAFFVFAQRYHLFFTLIENEDVNKIVNNDVK